MLRRSALTCSVKLASLWPRCNTTYYPNVTQWPQESNNKINFIPRRWCFCISKPVGIVVMLHVADPFFVKLWNCCVLCVLMNSFFHMQTNPQTSGVIISNTFTTVYATVTFVLNPYYSLVGNVPGSIVSHPNTICWDDGIRLSAFPFYDILVMNNGPNQKKVLQDASWFSRYSTLRRRNMGKYLHSGLLDNGLSLPLAVLVLAWLMRWVSHYSCLTVEWRGLASHSVSPTPHLHSALA